MVGIGCLYALGATRDLERKSLDITSPVAAAPQAYGSNVNNNTAFFHPCVHNLAAPARLPPTLLLLLLLLLPLMLLLLLLFACLLQLLIGVPPRPSTLFKQPNIYSRQIKKPRTPNPCTSPTSRNPACRQTHSPQL